MKTQYNQITHSILYNAGRGLISHSNAQYLKILHNEMHHARYGGETWDLGATYAIATDGKGTEIAYNYIHDSRSIGIYLDSSCYNFYIHHNVVDKTLRGVSDYFIGLVFNEPNANNIAFHNTILSSLWIDGLADNPCFGNIVKNNILGSFTYRPDNSNPTTPTPEEVDYTNNIELDSVDPYSVFADYDNKDFHLKAGSPAIDAGIDVGLTQDYEGNPIIPPPDIGAYEYIP
jgi:hypothetical protein